MSSPGTPLCNGSSLGMKISIERLDPVALRHFPETAVTNHMCNLCKRDIMAPSFDDLTKGKLDTKISVGKCKHCFHTDCIGTLLKTKSTTSCPICMTPWNLDHELDSTTFHRQLKPNAEKTTKPSTTSTETTGTTGTTVGASTTTTTSVKSGPVLKKVAIKKVPIAVTSYAMPIATGTSSLPKVASSLSQVTTSLPQVTSSLPQVPAVLIPAITVTTIPSQVSN